MVFNSDENYLCGTKKLKKYANILSTRNRRRHFKHFGGIPEFENLYAKDVYQERFDHSPNISSLWLMTKTYL
jgi:hypothetical protein